MRRVRRLSGLGVALLMSGCGGDGTVVVQDDGTTGATDGTTNVTRGDDVDDGPPDTRGTTSSDGTATWSDVTSWGDTFDTETLDSTTVVDDTFGTTWGNDTFDDTDSTTWGNDTFDDTDGTTRGTDTDDTDGTSTDGTSTDDTDTDDTSSDTGPLTCIEIELGSAVGPGVANGNTIGADDDLPQDCGGSNGPEVVHHWTCPTTGLWTFDTEGSGYDTALTLWHACDDNSAFACDDDDGAGQASLIEVELVEGEEILIAVEGFSGATGPFQLNIGGIPSNPLDAFEDPQPFGDSVQELDLIGTWNLPTDGGAPGYSMSLTINADGTFVWSERDAGCALVRQGTGVLWVMGFQLAMLFETYDGVAPWPVGDMFGWDAAPPFLLRAGYAPVLGHLAISAPEDLRVALPWASRGYARTLGGVTAVDNWVSETELWAVAPGDLNATIISRDRHTLEVEPDVNALYVFQRWWYDDGVQTADPAVFDGRPYTDDMAGHLDLEGQPYTYLGTRMASFAPGDNFQLGAPTACP